MYNNPRYKSEQIVHAGNAISFLDCMKYIYLAEYRLRYESTHVIGVVKIHQEIWVDALLQWGIKVPCHDSNFRAAISFVKSM